MCVNFTFLLTNAIDSLSPTSQIKLFTTTSRLDQVAGVGGGEGGGREREGKGRTGHRTSHFTRR